MILTLLNPETADLEKTYLSNSVSAGVTTLNVKNNNKFTAFLRIMIGEMGTEHAEIVTTGADSGGEIITLATGTVYPHPADEPIYLLRFDQARFYRSITGANGAYTLIANVNLDVDNANLSTLYDDVSGLATYYYKMSVYNSISTLESDFSDPISGSGWNRYEVGNIIDEVLQEVSDPNEDHVTRTELMGYFNDVNDELQNNVARPYTFLHTRTTLNRTAGANYIDFPTDADGRQIMWKFDRMDYNFTDSSTDSTVTIPVLPMEEFRNTYADNTVSVTTESDNVPLAISLDTAVNRFRFSAPFLTTTSNVFYLYYWKYFDVINSEGDVIETPTAKIYKLYLKAMYYTKRSVTEIAVAGLASSMQSQYEREKRNLIMANRKDAGTPRSFRPENSVTKSFRR